MSVGSQVQDSEVSEKENGICVHLFRQGEHVLTARATLRDGLRRPRPGPEPRVREVH